MARMIVMPLRFIRSGEDESSAQPGVESGVFRLPRAILRLHQNFLPTPARGVFGIGRFLCVGLLAFTAAYELRGERVLMSAEEITGGLAAVRALRVAGYEPWVALTRPRPLMTASRAPAGIVPAPDPALEVDGFARALAAAAHELRVVAVLPGSEEALLALAGRTHLFPAGVAVGIPEPEVVERALDKAVVADLATASGLETPPTTTLRAAELRSRAAELAYPVVLKPDRTKVHTEGGSLQRVATRRVESAQQLEDVVASARVDRWLVQAFLDGALAAVCGVVWDGRIVCASHQRADRIWPPRCGISAHAVTVARDEELERALERLLARIGWNGIFQAQFLRLGDRALFIDLNPRIYGSLALAVAAGLNLPAVWVDLLRGRTPSVAPYRVGTRFRAEGNDARALMSELKHGRWRAASLGALPRRGTAHAVFSLRDPLPALSRVRALVLAGRRRR
jgi:predicted ATP-grasp superfamily ATP-dependent carboligase